MSDINKDNNQDQTEWLIDKLIEKELVCVTFDAWYVNDKSVDEAKHGDLITARISLSGGRRGVYRFRIRRDVPSSGDETVIESYLQYDGNLIVKEQSFSSQQVTEKNSHGYFVEITRDSGDLFEDGSPKWIMSNSYPPRLKVTSL